MVAVAATTVIIIKVTWSEMNFPSLKLDSLCFFFKEDYISVRDVVNLNSKIETHCSDL